MKGRMYLQLYKSADALAGYFDLLALWAKRQWAATEVNPLKGRMVRYIRTGSDMGQDLTHECGVVMRTYTDTIYGSPGKHLMVEIRLESGASHCLPLRCFYENPDDAVLEYRW